MTCLQGVGRSESERTGEIRQTRGGGTCGEVGREEGRRRVSPSDPPIRAPSTGDSNAMRTPGSSVGVVPTRAASGWQLPARKSGTGASDFADPPWIRCDPVAHAPPLVQACSDVQQALGAQHAARAAVAPPVGGANASV